MSCIITYKGKQYSEEKFKEYFINNKEEFTTFISKNKDVIDLFKRKMEGIDYVFSQSPELASIGNKAQYLQYLSTIFKTSKVKDIVYRAEGNGQYNRLNKAVVEPNGGIYFTIQKTFAESFAKAYKVDISSALLNIKNTKSIFVNHKESKRQDENFLNDKKLDISKLTKEDINNLKLSNYDSVNLVYEPINGVPQFENQEVVVFESEQIHILGSKQDIEGFKNWVSSTPQSTNVDENSNQTHIDKINAKYDAELAKKELKEIEERQRLEEEKRLEEENRIPKLFNELENLFAEVEVIVNDLAANTEDYAESIKTEEDLEKLRNKKEELEIAVDELMKKLSAINKILDNDLQFSERTKVLNSKRKLNEFVQSLEASIENLNESLEEIEKKIKEEAKEQRKREEEEEEFNRLVEEEEEFNRLIEEEEKLKIENAKKKEKQKVEKKKEKPLEKNSTETVNKEVETDKNNPITNDEPSPEMDNLPDDYKQLEALKKLVEEKEKELEAKRRSLLAKILKDDSKSIPELGKAEKELEAVKVSKEQIEKKMTDIKSKKDKTKKNKKPASEVPDFFSEVEPDINDSYTFFMEADEEPNEQREELFNLAELRKGLNSHDLPEGSHVLKYPDNDVSKNVMEFANSDGEDYDSIYYVKVAIGGKPQIFAIRKTRTQDFYQILGMQENNPDLVINSLAEADVTFRTDTEGKKTYLTTKKNLEGNYKLQSARKLTFAYTMDLQDLNLSDIRESFKEGFSLTDEQADNLHFKLFLPTTKIEEELKELGLHGIDYNFSKGTPYLIVSNIERNYKNEQGVTRTFPVKPMIIKLSAKEMSKKNFKPIKDWARQLYIFHAFLMEMVTPPKTKEIVTQQLTRIFSDKNRKLSDIFEELKNSPSLKKAEGNALNLYSLFSKWENQNKQTVADLNSLDSHMLSFFMQKQALTKEELLNFKKLSSSLPIFVRALSEAKTLTKNAVDTSIDESAKLIEDFIKSKEKEKIRKNNEGRKTSTLEQIQLDGFLDIIEVINGLPEKEQAKFFNNLLSFVDLYYGEDSVFDVLKKEKNETAEDFAKRVEEKLVDLNTNEKIEGAVWNSATDSKGAVKFFYIKDSKKTFKFKKVIKASQGISPKTFIRIANANRNRLDGFQKLFLTNRFSPKGKNIGNLSVLLKAKSLLGHAIEGIREIQQLLSVGYDLPFIVNLSYEERINVDALEKKLNTIKSLAEEQIEVQKTVGDRQTLSQLLINIEKIFKVLATNNSAKDYSNTPLEYEDMLLLVDFFNDKTNPPLVGQIRKSQFKTAVQKVNESFENSEEQDEEFETLKKSLPIKTTFEKILPTRVVITEGSTVFNDSVESFEEKPFMQSAEELENIETAETISDTVETQEEFEITEELTVDNISKYIEGEEFIEENSDEELSKEESLFLQNFPKARNVPNYTVRDVIDVILSELQESHSLRTFDGTFTTRRGKNLEDKANKIIDKLLGDTEIKTLRTEVELPLGELISIEEFKNRARRYMPDITDDQIHALHQDLLQEMAGGISVRGMVKGLDVFVQLEDGGVRANVVRHELFHRIFEYYLPSINKQKLYDAYVELYGETPSHSEWEEILTRKFQTFPDLKSKPKNLLYRLYLKVMKFLKLMNDYEYEINKLFAEIESGKYQTRLSAEESSWVINRELPKFYEGNIEKDYGTVENFISAKEHLQLFISEITGNVIKNNRLGEMKQLKGTELNLGVLTNAEIFDKVIAHLFKSSEPSNEEGLTILRRKFQAFYENLATDKDGKKQFENLIKMFFPNFQVPLTAAQAYQLSIEKTMGEEMSEEEEDSTDESIKNEDVDEETATEEQEDLKASKGLKDHIENRESVSQEETANHMVKTFLSTFSYISSNGRKIPINPRFAFVKSVQILGGLNFNQPSINNLSYTDFLFNQIDEAIRKEGNNTFTKAIGERIKVIIKKSLTPINPDSAVVFLDPNTAVTFDFNGIFDYLEELGMEEDDIYALLEKLEIDSFSRRFKEVNGNLILKTQTELENEVVHLENGVKLPLFQIISRGSNTYTQFTQRISNELFENSENVHESIEEDFHRAWNRDLLAVLHSSIVSLRERAPYTMVKDKKFGVANLRYFPTVMLTIDQRIKEDIKNLFNDSEKRANLFKEFNKVFYNFNNFKEFNEKFGIGYGEESQQGLSHSPYYHASKILRELATQEKFEIYLDSLPEKLRHKTTFETYIKEAFKNAMLREAMGHKVDLETKNRIEKAVDHLLVNKKNISAAQRQEAVVKQTLKDLNAFEILSKMNLSYIADSNHKSIPLTVHSIEKATRYIEEGQGKTHVIYSHMVPEKLLSLIGFSNPVLTEEDVDKLSTFGFALINSVSGIILGKHEVTTLNEETHKKNEPSGKRSYVQVSIEESNDKITGQDAEEGEETVIIVEDFEEVVDSLIAFLDREHAQDLNRISRVLSKSNDFVRESTYRASDGKKRYIYTPASFAQKNARALVLGVDKSFPVPEHFTTPFYAANPLLSNLFRPIGVQEHDKSREADKHTEYKSETPAQYWERNFVGGFLSTLYKNRAEVVEFLDPAEDRPSIIGLRFSMLTKGNLKTLYAQLLEQLTLRPEGLENSKVYNRKSLINLKKLEELLNASDETLKTLTKRILEKEHFGDLTVEGNVAEIKRIIKKFNSSEGVFMPLSNKGPNREYTFMAIYLMHMFEEDARNIAMEMLKSAKFDLPNNMKSLAEYLGKYGLSDRAITYFTKHGEGNKFRIKRTFGEALDFQNESVKELHDALTDLVEIWIRQSYPNNYLAQQLISGDVAHFPSSQARLKRLGGSLAPGNVGLVGTQFQTPKTFKVAVMEELQGNIFSALEEFEKTGKYSVRNGISPVDVLDGSAFMLPERLEMLQRIFGEAAKPTSLVKSAYYGTTEKEVTMIKSNTTVLTDAYVEAEDTLGNKIFREKLRNLRDNLRAMGIDEIMPPSSLKVGERIPIPIDKLLNGKMTEEDIAYYLENSVLELNNSDYKIQLDPVTVKEEAVTNPSQLPYFLNIMGESVKEADNIYNAMAELYELGLENTLSKFETDAKLRGVVIDKVKGKNAADFIELLENDVDINYPLISNRVIANAIAAFSKSTVELKFSGGKMVLIPDLGIEIAENGQKRRLKPIINEDGLLYYEALLPRYMEKYVRLGDIFGVRIPTTEIHSATPLRIVGFYDNDGTNGIVVPYELIKVTGADFDVDSMFVIRPEALSDKANLKVWTVENFGKYKEQLGKKWKGLEKLVILLHTISSNREELLQLKEYRASKSKKRDTRYTKKYTWINSRGVEITTSLSELDRNLKNAKKSLMEILTHAIPLETQKELIKTMVAPLQEGVEDDLDRYVRESVQVRKDFIDSIFLNKVNAITTLPSNFAGIIVDKNGKKTFDEAGLKSLKQEIETTTDKALRKILQSKLKVMLKNKIFVNYLEVLQKSTTRKRMLSPISTDYFNKKGDNFKNDGLYAEGTVNRYIQDLKLELYKEGLNEKGLPTDELSADEIKKATILLEEYDLSNPWDKSKAYKSVFDGADLTGIFANFAKSLAYAIRSGITISSATKKESVVVRLSSVKAGRLAKLLELESYLMRELSKQLNKKNLYPDKTLRKRLSIVREDIDFLLKESEEAKENVKTTVFERSVFDTDNSFIRTSPTIKTFLGIDNTQLLELTDELQVWEIIDSLVNAAIDNLKEQILSILNANKTTAEALAASVALGMDIKTSALLLNQNVIKLLQFQYLASLKKSLVTQYGKDDYKKLKQKYEEADIDSDIKGIFGIYFDVEEVIPAKETDTVKKVVDIETAIAKEEEKINNESKEEEEIIGNRKAREVIKEEEEKRIKNLSFLTVQELEENFGKDGTIEFQLKVLMLFEKLSAIGGDINSLSMAISPLKAIPADAYKVQRILQNMEDYLNNSRFLGENLFETVPHIEAVNNVTKSLNSEILERYFFRFRKSFRELIIKKAVSMNIKLNKSDSLINESLIANEFFNYLMTNELPDVYKQEDGTSKPLQIQVTFNNSNNKKIHKTYTGTAAYSFLIAQELLQIKNDYNEAKKKAADNNAEFQKNVLLEGLEISQSSFGTYNVRFNLGVNIDASNIAFLRRDMKIIPTGWDKSKNEFASRVTSPSLMKKLFHLSVISTGMHAGQNTFNKGLPTELHAAVSKNLRETLKELAKNPVKFTGESERFMLQLAAKYPKALPFVVKDKASLLPSAAIQGPDGDQKAVYDGFYISEDKTVNFHYDLAFKLADTNSDLPAFIQTGSFQTAYVKIFVDKDKGIVYYKKLPKNNSYNINKMEEIPTDSNFVYTMTEFFRTDVPYFKEDAFDVAEDGTVRIYSAKTSPQKYADTFFLSKNSVSDNTDRILVEKTDSGYKLSEKPLLTTKSFSEQLEHEINAALFPDFKDLKVITLEESFLPTAEKIVKFLNESLSKMGIIEDIIYLDNVLIGEQNFKKIAVKPFTIPAKGLSQFPLFARVVLNDIFGEEQIEENAETEEECKE